MTVARKRIAVVTGGSSGIGLATVTTLLESGYRVAFFGRNPDHVASAEDKLVARFDAASILARTVDLSVPSEVRGFIDAIDGAWAMPDVLICNAGISPKRPDGRPIPFAEISLEEWNAVLAINLTGAMLCSQLALPAMIDRGFGRVVLVGSIAGRTVPRIAGAAYAASKAALAGLARSLVAASAGTSVTVNMVAPGHIATGMIGPLESEASTAAIARIPVGRIGAPEDVAAAITFLISDDAGFINGAILDINGGEFAPL